MKSASARFIDFESRSDLVAKKNLKIDILLTCIQAVKVFAIYLIVNVVTLTKPKENLQHLSVAFYS